MNPLSTRIFFRPYLFERAPATRPLTIPANVPIEISKPLSALLRPTLEKKRGRTI